MQTETESAVRAPGATEPLDAPHPVFGYCQSITMRLKCLDQWVKDQDQSGNVDKKLLAQCVLELATSLWRDMDLADLIVLPRPFAEVELVQFATMVTYVSRSFQAWVVDDMLVALCEESLHRCVALPDPERLARRLSANAKRLGHRRNAFETACRRLGVAVPVPVADAKD